MSCERPLRLPNPRYRYFKGAVNFDEDLYYGANIYDACESYFGFRDRPPDEFIDVPCGKCFSCQRTRLNGFRMRLLAELNACRYKGRYQSVFVTLTFSDDYLSRFKDQPNKAVRLFLDRARKKFGKQLRHWFCAEFGDTTGRLHYHGILFQTPPDLNPQLLTKLWKYGHCWLGWSNEKTVHYVVKYITKGSLSSRTLPRVLASKGLGLCYVNQRSGFHRSHSQPYIAKGKYRIPLPRYYLQKIFTEHERIMLQYNQSLEPFERFVDGYRYTDELSYRFALLRYSIKQIDIGLSHYRKKRFSALQSYDPYSALQSSSRVITPWNIEEHDPDSFSQTMYYYDPALVPMSDHNVYYKSLTPF